MKRISLELGRLVLSGLGLVACGAQGTDSARAIRSDWISSVTVPPGYTLRAYANGDFSGTETVYTSSTSYVGDDLNDTFGSLIVQ